MLGECFLATSLLLKQFEHRDRRMVARVIQVLHAILDRSNLLFVSLIRRTGNRIRDKSFTVRHSFNPTP
jgi:hypothetical protein